MCTNSKVLSILLSLALAMGLCPTPALASPIVSPQSAQFSTQSVSRTKIVQDNRNCVIWARSQVPSLPYGLNTMQDKLKIINGYTPVAGAVAIMDGVPADVGHVAVVRAVNGDRITIREANWIAGWVTEATSTASQLGIHGYYVPAGLHVPDPGPTLSGAAPVSITLGIYMIRSKIGDRVLDVTNNSSANGANIQLWNSAGVSAQIFNLGWNDDLKAHYFQLRSSSKFVDAQGGDGAVNVWQFEGNGGKGQHWFFEDAGDGYYYVRNVYGYYLDVEGGKASEGANVKTSVYTGEDSQKWKLADALKEDASPGGSNDTSGSPDEGADYTGGDSGESSENSSIVKSSIASASITGLKTKTYTGKALIQSPTVKLGSTTLKVGVDYELTYANNVRAGVATMTITGKGGYVGAKDVTFTIGKASIKKASAVKLKVQKYKRGKAVKPSPKIAYKGKTLKRGIDYTLSYQNNKKRGAATITMKGKGSFKGSKVMKFKIK